MKHAICLLFVCMLLSCSSHELILVGGSDKYAIVISESASDQEQEAAKVLQKYLKRISGEELALVTDNTPANDREILIGRTNRNHESHICPQELGNDGFFICTDNKDLHIYGGTDQGTLYGVYTFLEEYMGCRMYTSDAQVVPEKKRVTIPADIKKCQVPPLKYRYLGYRDVGKGEFGLWQKLSASIGEPKSGWGLFAESFGQLVPPDNYFEAHPEYYAYYNGKRTPSQLCLSNPEVLKIVVDDLRARIAKNPEAIYWSVSHNDNTGYCHCGKCAAIDQEENAPSGSIIRFVNQVASNFPDKKIATLAYLYSRKAPRKVKPADNVTIMFCNIECNRSRPLATDSLSASFRKDMEDWAAISNDIFVWDYVIQFKNLVSPFPNLRTLQPNMEYFIQHKVTSLFEQGNREVGGEFSELRSYLLAKLMWNPFANADSIITDFTNGYYGKGGSYVKQYIDLLHDNLEKSGDNLSIFGNVLDPGNSYLSPANMKKYSALFDQAEAEVQDDPVILQRVKTARLPITYVEIEQARTHPFESGSLFVCDNGKYEPNAPFINKINDFLATCKTKGITRLSEWHTTPDEYQEIIKSYTDMNYDGNFAIGEKCTFSPDLLQKNSKATSSILTDGLYGTNEYSSMWLRSTEKSYEITMDMKSEKKLHTIAAHFMNNNSSGVFLPQRVEFFLSEDGTSFQKVGEMAGPPVVNTNGHAGSYFSGTKPIPVFYKVDNINRAASYVKLKVTSIGECPTWHPEVGSPALVMIDEIVLR